MRNNCQSGTNPVASIALPHRAPAVCLTRTVKEADWRPTGIASSLTPSKSLAASHCGRALSGWRRRTLAVGSVE